MNKRIQELLEQAGVHYVVMPKDTVYEKFADLLLQDFCNTLEEQMRFDKVMKKEVGLDFEIDFVKEIKKFYASGFCACCGAPNNTPCDDSCVWSE